MGWVKGVEPSTLGSTIRCSNQLSYTHHDHRLRQCVARQKGFEPLTHGLEGRCSIHLSYWRTSGKGRGEPIRTADHLRPRQVRYQAALRPEIPPRSSHDFA